MIRLERTEDVVGELPQRFRTHFFAKRRARDLNDARDTYFEDADGEPLHMWEWRVEQQDDGR